MADASFFNNIKHLVIRDGKFNFNVQNIQVVEFAFATGQNDAIIPQGPGSQALYLLLAKARHLIGVLPKAHLELARHCAGWGRRYTTTELRNNVICVSVPLFTSSLFSVLPATVHFIALYILVAMVVLDILHPMRLERARLRAFVKVLDALGKYHDFPWAACENLTTFHAEFVKRCRNKPGFSFIKSRLYELEYNGCIMQQEDWKAVEPFTDISVNIFLIQEDAPMVMCPWCKRENSLPSGYEESADIMCSCAYCSRDFVVMGSLPAEPDDSVVAIDPRTNGDHVDPKILRLRVKMQSSGKNALPTSLHDELHAVVENRPEGSTSLVDADENRSEVDPPPRIRSTPTLGEPLESMDPQILPAAGGVNVNVEVTDENLNLNQLDPPPRSTPTLGEPLGSIRMLQPQSTVNPSIANDMHGLHDFAGIKLDHEIYVHLMTQQGRGYPLWVPGPGMHLPIEYRRQGIGIGDVGIISPVTGAFDFLFNIFLPAHHPINGGMVPPGFSPLPNQGLERDIQRTASFGPNSYLTSSSVRRTSTNSDGGTSAEQRFESNAKEAAILVMPDGATSHDLVNTSAVRAAILSNAQDWYTYARVVRGREIENGDLRVVVGTDKASSWGIATDARNGGTASYSFKPDYTWDCFGGTGRVGPLESEIHDLTANNTVPQNQCLFVRTLNFTVPRPPRYITAQA